MYKFFKDAELACKCGCKTQKMDEEFMRKLENIRERVGKPFYVTSAYRCPEYNSKVSTTGKNGPHTTGKAIDIKADSRLKYEIAQHAIKEGITRIGIAKTFIHLDDLSHDSGFSEKLIWAY